MVLTCTAGNVMAYVTAAGITHDPAWLAAAGAAGVGGGSLWLIGWRWRRRRARRSDDGFTDVLGLFDNQPARPEEFTALEHRMYTSADTGARLAAARARHRDLCEPGPDERIAWADLCARLESERDGEVSA